MTDHYADVIRRLDMIVNELEGCVMDNEMDWVVDETELVIENGIGELYRGFYRLRQSGQYQREYDMMGQLINMLQEDRAHLRSKYEVE